MKDYGELTLGRVLQKILSVKCNKMNKSKINIIQNGFDTDIYELAISIYFDNSDIEVEYRMLSHVLNRDKYELDYTWHLDIIKHVDNVNIDSFNIIEQNAISVYKYLNKYKLTPIDFYIGEYDKEITYDMSGDHEVVNTLENIVVNYNREKSIKNKTTMAADSSSTAMELLKLLKERNDLTLLTNSAEAFHELAQSEINVVSTGGELNKNTLSLQGRITKEIISRYHVDIMVMSCKGLDMQSGALDSNEAEAEIKKTMIRQATEVALLVDHSKFDRKAFVQLVDFSHINYLITNKAPGAEWIAFCKENNIQLVY